MDPGGTKMKGASTVVSGKCVLSLLLPLNEKRRRDISQEQIEDLVVLEDIEITVSLKKRFINFLADFVCALSVYIMMLAEFIEDTGSPRNGIMYACMTTCKY